MKSVPSGWEAWPTRTCRVQMVAGACGRMAATRPKGVPSYWDKDML
jgi:hypothetical protein